MNRTTWFLLLLPALLFAAIPGRFMDSPDIRNDLIIFSYEGDLWRVAASGGLATRLTVHPGQETAGKLSPDGASIAFTGDYDGGRNLYLIPSDGGAPKRLTWHHAAQALTWTPDGKKIVYRSSYENTFRPIAKLYSVSTDGAWPEKLPVPQGVLASFSPDGKKMAYAPRGHEEYYWKRYKGGQYQDIWLYDFETKAFAPLTDYVGKNAYPMWVGNKLYFVSDRGENGISNFYTYDFASKRVDQITFFHDFDVQMASSDGRADRLHALGLALCARHQDQCQPQGRCPDPQRSLAAGGPRHQSQGVYPAYGPGQRWQERRF